MRRILARLVALSLLGLLVFAPSAWAQGQEVTVSMEDNFFAPANITVEPGTTVTWVQNGSNPHTTTSNDGLWDSGEIAGGSGGSFSFTFEDPGTYDYVCTIHAAMGMVGTVTVTSATGTATETATETATATTSPAAGVLPATGGATLALPAALALVVFGLIALALLRRSSAS